MLHGMISHASHRLLSQAHRLMPIAVLLLAVAPSVAHATTAELYPFLPSPRLAGTNIGLLATSTDAELPIYKFEYRQLDGDWQLLRDYTRYNTFDWAPLEPGWYELRLNVLDFAATGEASKRTATETILPFLILPRIGATAAVAATSHPLVALFSAPSCPTGEIRVRFAPEGTTNWQYTDRRDCVPGQTHSFYIAGMRANTDYVMQQEWTLFGHPIYGQLQTFRSGVPDESFAPLSVTDAPGLLTDWSESVLLSGPVAGDNPAILATTARDLLGNVRWYYRTPAIENQIAPNILRPLPGGNMLFSLGNPYLGDGYRWQILREVDLAGNVVKETSVFSISLQLAAIGEDPITAIHHEAIRLPNGDTAILGNVERVIPSETGDREMIGDMIVVLDSNLQVTWTWNGFEHLDTDRRAILGETCQGAQPGCPQLIDLEGPAEDWMHTNSIDYTPDGHFLISMRHQDWVVKINYDDGTGDGSVLWRLGRDGDFTFISDDPWPEFSHQHDAEIEENGLLTVFDNGNTRIATESGNSRGQALLLDEQQMTATIVVNADLGEFAPALGAAELLSNGNYSFSAGGISITDTAGDASFIGDLIETTATGDQVYRQRQPIGIYRHFRGPSMYDLD